MLQENKNNGNSFFKVLLRQSIGTLESIDIIYQKKLKTFLIIIPPPGYNWFVRNLCPDLQNMYFLLSSYDDSLTPFKH